MGKVIVRRTSYDYQSLRKIIFDILDDTIGGRIRADSRVVIKPNLLAPAPPERAIVTHPLIVRAAAEYVVGRGARPLVADSPAGQSFRRVLRESGIAGALKGMDVKMEPFTETVGVDIGKPFGSIEIAAEAVNADILINLPKLKTHSQMMLTLGIKNLFGCIVGMKKPEWHLRAGVDREMFGMLLVRIARALSPSVTILDGILSMEGDGPGRRGIPREIGVVIGGGDVAAVDIAVCNMLGIDPMSLLTNRIAIDSGMTGNNPEIDGSLPRVSGFEFPEIVPVVFGPDRLHGFMRRHLVQRPECSADLCRLCGECWKYCPAHAISHDDKRISFNYDLCIRCYCCIEVCPHGALGAHETIAGRIVRRILRI
jgi:uncharacterized protein (DUF362 family)/Pyruvate/2-oxoacid:ferredoxin oxidoreductase delta subunit